MKDFFTAKRLCRAGIIAALYVALTCAFGMMSYVGLFQFRPAEALCLLPLFYAEAVPALWVGCMLANVISLYGVYDVFIGSAVTLVAAVCTYLIGRAIRETGTKMRSHLARVFLGGIFPVTLNALIIPVVIVYIGGFTEGGTASSVYLWNFVSLFVSQSIWVYALGAPLYFFVTKMRKKNVAPFTDGKRRKTATV